MRLPEILSMLETLDRAYETIAEEHGREAPGSPVPSWEALVRGTPQRTRGVVEGDLPCADHGRTHGLSHGPLTDQLATELAGWTRLAEHSPTARSILGIESLRPANPAQPVSKIAGPGALAGPGARLGAMAYRDEAGQLQARFATTGALLVPSGAAGEMWQGPPGRVSFRDPSAPADRAESDPSLTHTCPTPKLLGSLTGDNLASPNSGSRVAPLALSEAWLFDDTGAAAGGLAPPCEACRRGLSAWTCGVEDILSPDPEAATEAAEWAARFAERPAPPPGARASKPASLPERGGSPSPSVASAASSVASLPGIQSVSKPAVAPLAASAAPDTPMLDLPDRDVTGTSHRRSNDRPSRADPAESLLAGQRRERARVRLESSDFPCEDVEIRELSGHEAISRLFSFQVEIVCLDRDALQMEQLVGASATLVFERGPEEVRRVHGMISEVEDGLETEAEWRSFRLSIVPRLWRSTLVETQEVNLDSTVPDIVLRKLALVGLEGADVEPRLLGNYPVRDLVVQYKETDLAFVSRLTEHLGICFFFDHQSGADRLVLSDSNAGFQPLPGAPALAFRPRGEASDVFEIKARSRAFPAHFAAQDYNYRTPRVDLTRVFEARDGFGGGVIEYGSHHKTPAEGDTIARIRAEERQIASQGYIAKSDVPNVTAGGRFTLTGHERLEGRELLVVEVEHFAHQTVRVHGAGSADEAYRNTFRCVDAVLPYRPPRATPRPRIHGVLTALVEPNPDGEIGESARIDPEGRYTVKFYFDASDPAGRNKNSRLTRMIQPHAGPGYGLHFPLKPGIEVAMIFMDGDPDRPMILGATPNPVTPSPVVAEVNLMNRIETASGIVFEMRDAVPPIEK